MTIRRLLLRPPTTSHFPHLHVLDHHAGPSRSTFIHIHRAVLFCLLAPVGALVVTPLCTRPCRTRRDLKRTAAAIMYIGLQSTQKGLTQDRILSYMIMTDKRSASLLFYSSCALTYNRQKSYKVTNHSTVTATSTVVDK